MGSINLTKHHKQYCQFPGKSGTYNLRVASWLPKLKVNVFQNSIEASGQWRFKYAGVILNPGAMLEKGCWEGPLKS